MNASEHKGIRLIVIGGSAGSFRIVSRLITGLPETFDVPLIVCLHRLKNIKAGMLETIGHITTREVREPRDKDPVKPGTVYVAPANYHLLLEEDLTFALSTYRTIHHSRPSIDLTMESAAQVYGPGVLGILLSGANSDGAAGMRTIRLMGGSTLVQDPVDAEIASMPNAALKLMQPDYIFREEKIITFIQNLHAR